MSGYDHKDRRTYVFPLFDYGGAAGARADKVRGPKGKAGRLVDYGVMSVLEAFAGTTPATIAVGTSADPDAYGQEFSLDAVAVADGGKSVQSTYDIIADAANWALNMLERDIPKDSAVYITSTEAVTGPTGQACPYVVIDWDW
jgi:hypothetical protein